MAITITPVITGQDVSSTTTYAYLYEPLKIKIVEDDSDATQIYVDLAVYYNTDSSTVIVSDSNYGVWDYNGTSLEIDLMKIVRQYHDANVYQIGDISDITALADTTILSQYIYRFHVHSDVTTGNYVNTLPILGGRDFYDFTTSIDQNSPLTEADLLGVDLTGRFYDYPNFSVSIVAASSADTSPTVGYYTETGGDVKCGGMLVWKSRFGGWMYWAFDFATRTPKTKYTGVGINIGMMEGNSSGNPYVETDYTGVEYGYSANVKALGLTSDELEAVSGIRYAPVCYYLREAGDTKLELVRITSVSAPISTLANGGDFSVGFESISKQYHQVR